MACRQAGSAWGSACVCCCGWDGSGKPDRRGGGVAGMALPVPGQLEGGPWTLSPLLGQALLGNVAGTLSGFSCNPCPLPAT